MQGPTKDQIIKSLPSDVRNQRIYMARIVFLGVSKDRPEYVNNRIFSVNGHRYQVVDGAIAYLPKEAMSALGDAVPVKAAHKTEKQKEHGLSLDKAETYQEVPIPRYDITIMKEFEIVERNGSLDLSEVVDNTKKEADEIDREKIRQEYKEELEAEIRKEMAVSGPIILPCEGELTEDEPEADEEIDVDEELAAILDGE